jgi:hypothetical protein
MNALLRLLLVCASLILLIFASTEATAGPRRSLFGSSGPTRYSIVEEYKGAYAKPSRTLFGKRKMANKAHVRRAPKW